MEIFKEYMDEKDGYYLYVNFKSDNKYHLVYIYNDKVTFVIEYVFSTILPDSKLFTKIENNDMFKNILKTAFFYDDVNLEKTIFKESDDNIRLRKKKRKLSDENISLYPSKRIDGKRKSKRKSKKSKKSKRKSKKSKRNRNFRSRSKF